MTQRVRVDGKPVRYQVIGEGKPLILIHGLSGSSLWWLRNIKVLAQFYRVYLVDLPGFGSLGVGHPTLQRFTLERARNWLLHWMDQVGLEKAHLMGHSMGGYLCLSLAARYPQRVICMVVVSPAARPQAQHIIGYVRPLMGGIRYLTPQFLGILSLDAFRMGPLTFFQAVREIISIEIQQDIDKIIAPTLLVWGEDDTLVPPALGYALRQEMTTARLLILKRAGHVSMYDQATLFNQSALDFLLGKEVGE